MTQLVKVYTPIKRVPTMIGKAQNGQKLPFGPYTLPQVVAGVAVLLVASVLAMVLPSNPAVTFIVGVILAIAAVFGAGLIPYSGVRMSSRIVWFGRLLVVRKPASASGMPIGPDSTEDGVFVDESIVVLLPVGDDEPIAPRPAVAVLAGQRPLGVLEKWGAAVQENRYSDEEVVRERD